MSRGILGVAAVSLALGAAQFASGRDLSEGLQKPAATQTTTVNRAAKADRAARVASAMTTQTVVLRFDGLAATSVLLRIPVAQAVRNGSSAGSIMKSPERKMKVACEPMVSVLTEVAKQLQPGRCVT
jgi:hypothetical protein